MRQKKNDNDDEMGRKGEKTTPSPTETKTQFHHARQSTPINYFHPETQSDELDFNEKDFGVYDGDTGCNPRLRG